MTENQNFNSNPQILLFKKYNLIQNIGGGAFGTVFLGENVWTREKVAIKIEERKNQKNSLEKEAYILYLLKGPGLPEVISFGKTKRYNILVETLLGRSLYQIFNDCDKKFTLKDICMLAIQMIERLEYIHSKNFIHRDIKPHNFLVSQKNESYIYLIDFGLAKKYRSERGNHVKFTVTKHITGTPRFCSINAIRGVEQSRRDDLESLSYLILYFLKGSLPWQGLKIASRHQRFKEINKLKKNLKIEAICQNCPPEIMLFCKYTRKLGFTENPKYEYMKQLFTSILNKYGYANDNKFSWLNNQNNNDIQKISNKHTHKKSPHRRLIAKLRTSLEEKQRAKSKERDNIIDYTLTTIVMDNNNISTINETNKGPNEFGKKILIKSNDNNVLMQNNLIQLNLENSKRSYNYPLLIYNNNLSQQNEDDNFNKIIKTFQSNDSNVLKQNEINIPDKISMINATASNLVNMQFSANQEFLFPENEKSKEVIQNKSIKIHDYIRQEEKEGGVIDKDFDYRENEYFKINKPVFPSDPSEQENDTKMNKLGISTKNNEKEKGNIIFPNKAYVSHNNLNTNYLSTNNRNINNIRYTNEYGIKNTQAKSYNRKIIVTSQDTEKNKVKRSPSPKNNELKYSSFFTKKININLNKNKNNISNKNISPSNNYNHTINYPSKGPIKYLKLDQKNNFIQEYPNTNKAKYQINNLNTSYDSSNVKIKGSTINNTNYYQIGNNNLMKDKLTINNNNINPKMKIFKISGGNNSAKNNANKINYIRKINNYKENNLNISSRNQIISFQNKPINFANKLRNGPSNNALHMSSRYNKNNNPFVYESQQNKSYQIQTNYQKMNLNSHKANLKKIQNDKNNNIIINNVIIRNNCDNLLYKNNFNDNLLYKNQGTKNEVNRNNFNSYKIQNSDSHNQYKSFLQRNKNKNNNQIMTEPK